MMEEEGEEMVDVVTLSSVPTSSFHGQEEETELDLSISLVDAEETELGDQLPIKPIRQTCFGTSLEMMGCRSRQFYVDDSTEDCSDVWPEKKANILSKLTFNWMGTLLMKGWRHALEHKHLWQLDPGDSAKSLRDRFMTRFGATRSFVKALHQSFGWKFYSAAIFKFIYDILNFSEPMILSQIIIYLQNGDPLWQGILLACSLLAIEQIKTILINQYFHIGYRSGMHFRAASITAIYEKSLVLSSNARREISTGEIVDLMSNDSQKLMNSTAYLHILWSGPFQIILALILLFYLLGIATFVGVGVMLLMIPLNSWFVSALKKVRVKMLKFTDERVRWTNEIFQGIRVVKLFALENGFLKKILGLRSQELEQLKRLRFLKMLNSWIAMTSPLLVCIATLTAYALLGNTLTAEVIFPAMTLFNLLRFPLAVFPNMVSSAAEMWVSIKRINRFLNAEEVRPIPRVENIEPLPDGSNANVLLQGSFGWSEDSSVLFDMDLKLRIGDSVGVIGAVGSGKSSLISALLGEMYSSDGVMGLIGSLAFVPQQAWIINATLRDNILFGKEYDEDKYKAVLEACALLPDLDQLVAGDMTEIGEKGINLSGGQKQRVSIARAVYQDADIYVMDDPLSAVDAHVARHLFENVICDVLKEKTVILVTHYLHFLSQMDQVVVMKEGRIEEQGTYDDLLVRKGEFARLIDEYTAEQKEEEGEEVRDHSHLFAEESPLRSPTRVDSPAREVEVEVKKAPEKEKNSGTLVEQEERDVGAVKFQIYYRYLMSARSIILVSMILLGYTSVQGTKIATDYWMSYWSEQSTTSDRSEFYYLSVYIGLGAVNLIISGITLIAVAIVSLRSARIMHFHLLQNIMRAPMSFFETTPLGRILNRFAKDTDNVDISVPDSLSSYLNTLVTCLGTFLVIIIVTPASLLGIIPIMYIYYRIQQFYRSSSRELKRIDSISKSPLFAHFSETLSGISSIRAYNATLRFVGLNEFKVDYNHRAYFAMVSANRWLGIRLETISSWIVGCCAFFIVLERNLDPSLAGLALSYAFSTTNWIAWFVRATAEVEQNMNSAERILYYSDVPTESLAPSIHAESMLRRWPNEGRVEFKNAVLKYRKDLPPALNNVSFTIEPRMKIGVCGRTGAGKSSLLVALFRLVELYSGTIEIDGINIADIDLQTLRSRLAIIPQDPVLFTGTVRSNIDPFSRHSDESIWEALEMVQMKRVIEKLDGKLDSSVSEMGTSFSVGQRQLLCFARALLGDVHVLLLDEATASCDMETDALIQNTIRERFKNCTVITIAHRLNTIMDSDRIMVMEAGALREYDTPYNLVYNRKSALFAMVKETGDAAEYLINMAYQKHLSSTNLASSK